MEQTDIPIIGRASRKLALIAHDTQREALIDLLAEFLPLLKTMRIVAPYVTGTTCADALDLEVELVQSTVKGGDLQIGAMIVQGEVDAVIYLRDALFSQPYNPDIAPILRVCDIHRVPIATNIATARAVLNSIKEARLRAATIARYACLTL